ncbi:MAG: hypothetical protein WDK96_01400 [Candidatus Paceibacterota bacterium]|jgi:hypothetical protein
MAKTVIVTKESESGRNLNFHDNKSGKDMTRTQFVTEIEKGNFDDYHVRMVHGLKTPISNPDQKESNNLD